MNTHDIGDRVRIEMTFKDYDAVLTDGDVVCTITDPAGVTQALATSPVSTGIYRAAVTVDQEGTWRYRAVMTGALAGAEEGAFSVRKRWVPDA